MIYVHFYPTFFSMTSIRDCFIFKYTHIYFKNLIYLLHSNILIPYDNYFLYPNGGDMSNSFGIIAIGDIVGQVALEKALPAIRKLRDKYSANIVIANGENAAEGNGLDPATAEAMLFGGVDVITSGNHIWQKRAIYRYIDETQNLIRPLNYPASAPGNGYVILPVDGLNVLVMNVMGRVFLDPLACPFASVQKVLDSEKGNYDISILDIHAEATSEKIALSYYFDGKINLIFGTHTHVQTADERILPEGSGYITDIGMTGALNSVLGVKKECIIEKLTTNMPVKFETDTENIHLSGVYCEIDTASGKAINIERLHQKL